MYKIFSALHVVTLGFRSHYMCLSIFCSGLFHIIKQHIHIIKVYIYIQAAIRSFTYLRSTFQDEIKLLS